MFKRLFYTLLIFTLFSSILYSQNAYNPQYTDPLLDQWRWRHFPELDGKMMIDMSEDNEGIMWFLTIEGLLRYDGYQWSTFDYPEDYRIGDQSVASQADRGVICNGDFGSYYFSGTDWIQITPSIKNISEKHYKTFFINKDFFVTTTSGGVMVYNNGKHFVYTIKALAKQIENDSNIVIKNAFEQNDQYSRFEIRESVFEDNKIHFYIFFAPQRGKLTAKFDTNSSSEPLIFEDAAPVETDIPIYYLSNNLKSSKNVRWFISYSVQRGIYEFRNGEKIEHEIGNIFGDRTNHSDIVEMNNGTIIVAGEGQIYTYTNDTWKRYRKPHIPLTSTSFIKMQKNKNGNLWIGGQTGEVFLLEYSTQKAEKLENLFYQTTDKNGNKWYIEKDGRIIVQNGNNWTYYNKSDGIIEVPSKIICSANGLILCSGVHNGKATVSILHNDIWKHIFIPSMRGSIDKRSLYVEANGDIWGGNRPGLPGGVFHMEHDFLDYFLESGMQTFNLEKKIPLNPNINKHRIPGIIEAEDFNTGGEGIAYHDQNNFNIGEVYRPNEGVDLEFCTDNTGNFNVGWISNREWLKYTIKHVKPGKYNIRLRIASGTDKPGIVHFEIDDKAIGNIETKNTGDWQKWDFIELKDVEINKKSFDFTLRFERGNLNLNYIEFVHHDVVANKTTMEKEKPVHERFATFKVLDNSVGVAPGPGDKLYVSSNNNLREFEGNYSNRFTLSGKPSSLAGIKNKVLWIGTEDLGLYKYDGDTLINFNINSGLASNTIVDVFIDSDTTVWLATEKEFSRFDGSTWINYCFPEKFNIEKEGGEINVDGEGNIWISVLPKSWTLRTNNNEDIEGDFFCVRLRPDTLPPTQKFVFHSKDVDPEGNTHIIWEGVDYLNETLPEDILYSYKLNDDPWIPFTKGNSKTFMSLESGKYELQLKAKDKFGNTSINTEKISFRVKWPIYLRMWFLGMVAFFLVVVFILIRRIILKNKALNKFNEDLKEQKEEILTQNEEIQQQAEELATQKDALAEQNEQISQSFKRFEMLSEFGQKITATLDIDSIYDMIFSYARSVIDIDAFGIGLHDEKENLIYFPKFYHNKDVEKDVIKRLDDEKSLTAYCYNKQELVFISDFEEEAEKYGLTPTGNTNSALSRIHIPLTVEEKRLGLLVVNSSKAKAYSKEDLTNLQTLASYISIALDNAKAYDTIHLINKNTEKSINYASTIQNAFLPQPADVNNYINAFILFKPKDIVSGDYYWFYPIEQDPDKPTDVIIAAMDCTGHGVPGALMSLVGNNLMREIIIKDEIYEPAEILTKLNQGVKDTLKQETTGNNDGMDAAMVRIQEQGNSFKVTFGGAKNPLILIKPDNSLENIKGSRASIGGAKMRRAKVFEQQELTLQKGDHFYLFSDGYADQNGPTREKFGRDNMLKLLQESAELSLTEQQLKLEDTLQKHMGKAEQRDDITLIGIKL